MPTCRSSVSRESCLALAIHTDSRVPELADNVASTLCWHCCHAFSGLAIPLPVDYNERTQKWKMTGSFCSWACAKAWNWDLGGGGNYRSGIRGQLLAFLKKKTTGTLGRGIVPAPPRSCLKVFGGTLTIDEFRSVSSDGIIIEKLPEKMVPLHQIVNERRVEAKRVETAPGPNMQEAVDFGDATQKNETLRLKRPRPMPSSSDVLARSMGLEIFVTAKDYSIAE